VSLGQRIKQRREILQITQQELAKALGMTPQHISLIEQDKTTPSLAVVSKLAEQLGASIDYLVSGKEGVSTDIIPAIKADNVLSLDAKRALVIIVELLRAASRQGIAPPKDTS
jgi:transcriptional regulator with XRE-family HTH domain